jgi:DivIVA domain-containing protein
MDLTPESLRSATFRDKLRGYHPDDVDEFLESVARGLEVLLARLRDANEKARTAPSPESRPQPEEAVKTLVLAQKTADLAIHEAKAEADRLVKAAEQKARRLVTDAEDAAAHLAERAQAELRADLEKLQAARDQLSGEIRAMSSWLEGERGRIRRALIEVADRVDNVREAGNAPAPKPVAVPTPPRQKLERERARAANTPARPKTPAAQEPAPARPAEPAVEHAQAPAAPPVERPKASAAPPPAAPSPYQKGNTPPAGQPAVGASQSQPTVARQVTEPSDAAVLNRAQEGLTEAAEDDDPFFAELRAAMTDQSPLGPRDEDEQAP